MKDIKTKEVTTKPKTKNPASRIPKELMRTAILESKEKSQTIANARDNDMGEQSPSEYASGKVTSAEEWAARKTGRTVTRAGKTAAQTSYEKIKQRAAGKKEAEKEAEKETARGTGDTQTADPASREATKQKTAYEIDVCDWSSDVCSSDLRRSVCPLFLWRFLSPLLFLLLFCQRLSV